MRSFRASFCKIKVSRLARFAALLFLSPVILAPEAVAQKSDNAQESEAPRQSQDPQASASDYDKAIFQKAIPSDQLQFLAQFAGTPTNDVIRDKQYRKSMQSVISDCMFHYGRDMMLPEALVKVLIGSPLPVQIRDGRYVMVSSRSGPYLAGRGFMWIDMQDGIALGGFFFRPTNGEPTPTVTIFSRQLSKEKSIKMTQLPAAFAEDLSQWSADSYIPAVTTRYSISGANRKVLLEHDENYCAPADPTKTPVENDCEQMNADAADIDMNAAYYLEQTHHATNGTAWMIGADQTAWIQLRDDTCRTGPDALKCHIRMTRQRTHALLDEK